MDRTATPAAQAAAPATPGPSRSAAHYFLEGLNEIGVDYIFSNFGTDHVALIEEMARGKREGREQARTILCPHENVAVHMAAGYAAMTGRGQAVMVHVDAGTANAAMGLHNMFRGRLPVMLIAGRAPYTLRGELPGSRDNYVHFVQDPFDIASLVRPYVKWEYSLPSGVVAKEALRRGHAVMHSDPPGPVYMTLPRETLAEQWAPEQVRAFPADRYGAVAAGGIDPLQAESIARQLVDARSPIAVTAYLGRKAPAVHALQALAQRCGIRVYEFMPTHMNLPRDHPCFGGFDPKPGLADADVGLLLDVDVPWLPKFATEHPDTRWTHIDVDPIKRDFPMWGFATHTRLQADCGRALEQVLEAVERLATPEFERRVAQRIAGWEEPNAARRAALTRAAGQRGASGAISPQYVCATLGAALRQDDIVINEAIRNSPAVLGQIPRTEPMTLLGCSGGGLGYSGGLALGVKLARPACRVVQVVGDGGFHFSTPTSVYAVAQNYGLPILTVVLDNGGWQAVKEAVLRVYPDGEAAGVNDFQARLDGRQRRFDQVAQAFGAHGEHVAEPDELPAAITRCLQALDGGQAALLHVRIGQI
ncbi:thiamine pyrophosphate protein [Bordetella ansorpii]|uniref:Thiamine pyrophosphate protein n=1 Tax=Bordetella ansorpii TaxID=288768 RepID=A0A157SBM0_9BORD|nr:thiamine pyrophosphate-requiring protein [Bordetella ansorpii]SAI67827.1 thiamine pyrophosphate protein [Bordetella ansorpii]